MKTRVLAALVALAAVLAPVGVVIAASSADAVADNGVVNSKN